MLPPPPRSRATFRASSKEMGCKRKPFILEPAEGTETPLKPSLAWGEILHQPIFCFQLSAALWQAAGRVQPVHAFTRVCMRVHACACLLLGKQTSYPEPVSLVLIGVPQSGLVVGNHVPNKAELQNSAAGDAGWDEGVGCRRGLGLVALLCCGLRGA